MSCPKAVVPSRCCRDGVRLTSKARSCGSCTEVKSCGKAASTQKIRKMTSPAMALRLLRMAVTTDPPGRPLGTRGALELALAAALAITAVIASPVGPGAGIERESREVADQHRQQDGDGDQQEQRLHQRVVDVDRRVVQLVAQARVVERVLDQ